MHIAGLGVGPCGVKLLTYQRTIAYIIQDIQSLRSQLVEQPGSQPASVADSLTALLLQIRAFNALDPTGETTPIQLQINSAGSFSDKSVSEQVEFLDGLVRALQSKAAEIAARWSRQCAVMGASFKLARNSAATPQTMLHTGPASGAWDKRELPHLVNNSDVPLVDLHTFHQCTNHFSFIDPVECFNTS